MTQRDRTVLMVLGIVGLVAAFWFAALKPKNEDAKALDTQIDAARQRLQAATATVSAAEQARAGYDEDYKQVALLGKAVPQDDDTASLVYQLEAAADRAKVDFRSIQVASGSGAAALVAATPAGQVAAVGAAEKGKAPKDGKTATTAATTPAPAAAAPTQIAAATLPPGASVGPAGFPTMPFDFTFTGRFFSLERFLTQLDRFTQIRKDGTIKVRGRLMTVDGIALAASSKGFPSMVASIKATAYMLPAEEGLTNGATPAGPTGSAPATAAGTTAPATTTGVNR